MIPRVYYGPFNGNVLSCGYRSHIGKNLTTSKACDLVLTLKYMRTQNTHTHTCFSYKGKCYTPIFKEHFYNITFDMNEKLNTLHVIYSIYNVINVLIFLFLYCDVLIFCVIPRVACS